MSDHRDTNEMRPSELRACGCPRCLDALRVHDMLDTLIASQAETRAALDRLEQAIDRLERKLGADE